MSETYTDIVVRIHGLNPAAGSYAVEATLDDGSHFEGELRLDPESLLLLELEPQEYGLALFEALFAGPIRRAYDKVTGRAESETGGRVRVHLWINEGAAELHALPWERIYHIHRGQEVPLATSVLTPFSRYTGLEMGEARPVTAEPLRVLFAVSNPGKLPQGLKPVAVEEEVRTLHEALGDLRRAGRFSVTVMPGRTGLPEELRSQLEEHGYRVESGAVTLEAILGIMRQPAGCHVLHFVGHGHFRPGSERGEGTAALYMETADGAGWEAVKDEELVPALVGPEVQPRLVFLQACESAKRDARTSHPFVGLAPKLVAAGIPAVVAMQDLVPMDLARQLAGGFYGQLAEHGIVDRALNAARLLLFDHEQVDWAIPALFMRLHDGQLFAADPVYEALRTMQSFDPRRLAGGDEYLEMPLEVVHLMGPQDPATVLRLGQDPVPSRDLLQAAFDVFARREERAQLVLLVGERGMARSTQLRRLVWATVQASLGTDAAPRVLPIYVTLEDFPALRLGARRALEVLLFESLKPFWPGELAEAELVELLESAEGPVMRVLLDGSDDLPDTERRAAWRGLQELMRAYPRHEYVLAINPAHYDPRRLENATDLLAIQPMSSRKVQLFLEDLADSAGPALYEALRRTQLFDLAGIPWLLARMVSRAREGRYPHSRAEILRDLVGDAMAEVPTERGMGSRAGQTLQALAWEMHSAHANTCTVEDALRWALVVRGNREYGLEELLDTLVQHGLLGRVGYDSLRFAYPFYQSFCCAQAIAEMADRDRVLDDITASLGRLSRLRWWEDTLVLLGGLLRNPEPLLRSIVYGAILTEGEQVYLAVRCLAEARQASAAGQQGIGQEVANRVIDALVWRLDPANEPLPARRARAAQALGQLRDPSTIPYLTRTANQQIRPDWQGKPDYEYSSVRMAAATALKQICSLSAQHFEKIAALDHPLADLLQMWAREDVAGLATALTAKKSTGAAIAAFALGDLQTPEAVELLIRSFLDPETAADMRWAVTDALALLDPALVTRRAILPLLNAETAASEQIPELTWKRRAHWYERLAYLIGRVGTQDPAAHTFLDRCLTEFTDIGLKARAIRSLGTLGDRRYKAPFEQIAVGVPPGEVTIPEVGNVAVRANLPEEEAIYLRQVAIETLAVLGDQDTLTSLRQSRGRWPPRLEQAFYWTSEEISWRLSLAAGR